MRRLSDSSTRGYHRVNETQVNPYENFTMKQALKVPRRETDWNHEMRYEIQKVEDNLFIGPWVAAKKLENIFAHEITHLLAVTQTAYVRAMKSGRDFEGVEYNYNGRQGRVSYREIEFDDREWVPVGQHIRQFVEALEEARRAGGSLLVYCLQGISQSPTLVIGHLMMARGWVYIESYRYLHNVRFCIHPNDGFISQLMDLEKIVKAEDQTSTQRILPGGRHGAEGKRRVDEVD